MKEALETTIKTLAERAAKCQSALEAMQFAQAALNAANTLLTVLDLNKR